MKRLGILLILIFMNTGMYSQEEQVKKETEKTFESVLIPYVEELTNAVETGAEFIVQEAPVVVKQFLYFKAFESWFYIAVSLFLIFFLSLYLARSVVTKSDEEPKKEIRHNEKWYEIEKGYWAVDVYSDLGVSQAFYWISLIVIRIIGVFMFFDVIFTAVKVTFFPKLYLVERFLDLL